MNSENFWKLFSLTGKVEDYLKYVNVKNDEKGVNKDEIFSTSSCNKRDECWRK